SKGKYIGREYTLNGKPKGQSDPMKAPIRAMAYGPDNSVVVGGTDHFAHLYFGKPIAEMKHDFPVYGAAYNPDPNAHNFVTVCGDKGKAGYAQIWTMMKGKPVGKRLEYPDRIKAVAYSPDGAKLLTGTLDGKMQLWNVAAHKMIGIVGDYPREVMTVA